MKISKEVTVGIIAILSMALLYWGFNFLSGKNLFEKSRTFYAVYDDVDGLMSSRPVFINGLKVGQVEQIYFHPDNSGRLIVKMTVSNDFNFPKTTTAKVVSDLLGDKTIDLILGEGGPAAETGDTLGSQIELSLAEEVNRQVAPLKSKAEKLIGSIDTVLILVSGFLNEDTKGNFQETFNSLRRSFVVLENTIKTVDNTVTESQDDLKSVIENIASIADNLEKNNEDLTNIFGNISSVTDSLAKVNLAETFTSLDKALVSAEQIMTKINDGEGSAGKLINDPELYQNLENASQQLNDLLLDVKYNPNRYVQFSVFGNKKTYTPAEIVELEAEAEKKRKELKEEETEENQ